MISFVCTHFIIVVFYAFFNIFKEVCVEHQMLKQRLSLGRLKEELRRHLTASHVIRDIELCHWGTAQLCGSPPPRPKNTSGLMAI